MSFWKEKKTFFLVLLLFLLFELIYSSLETFFIITAMDYVLLICCIYKELDEKINTNQNSILL